MLVLLARDNIYLVQPSFLGLIISFSVVLIQNVIIRPKDAPRRSSTRGELIMRKHVVGLSSISESYEM